MRDQLKKHIDLLFTGEHNADEIKQEILQNMLDRYDDLITQGKSPQSAYQQTISGIGNIRETLPSANKSEPANTTSVQDTVKKENSKNQRCPQNMLINKIIWILGLVLYLVISLYSGLWYLTWILFPILGCITGIADCIFDFRKSKPRSIIGIVLYSVLICILLVGAYGITSSIDTRLSSTQQTDKGYIKNDVHVSPSEIQKIEIEWIDGSIRLESGDVSEITIHETYLNQKAAKPMEVSQVGDTVVIEFSVFDLSSILPFGSHNTFSKDLVITVPHAWSCETLEIESVSSSITIQELAGQEFNLTGVSGEIQITDCNVDNLDLQTVSGEIHFIGSLNILDCDSVSAKCTVEISNHPTNIDMDSTSGDFTIYLPIDCGYSVDLNSMNGTLLPDNHTTIIDGKAVYKDGNCQIDVDTLSGIVIIKDWYRK